MYKVKDKVEKILIENTYKNRIQELNEIIGKVTNENIELKKQLNDIENYIKNIEKNNINYLFNNINFLICKYTPFMIKNTIKNMFNLEISSKKIVSIAAENNFFEYECLALRIPRKENYKDKFESTVVFSKFAVSILTEIIMEKYTINPNIGKDSLYKSIKEMNEGKVTKYTLDDLIKMEEE